MVSIFCFFAVLSLKKELAKSKKRIAHLIVRLRRARFDKAMPKKIRYVLRKI